MKLFSITRECFRYSIERIEYGYLDPTEFHYQDLRVVFRILGFRVFSWSVVRENIPSGCYYSFACTGSTSWESKHPELIEKWQKHKVIF